ncbi:MAG TPA: phosphoserine aminotransferase, partial [bacterium]|nr:phosphoserine aminotransferase [bacterium]
MSKPSVKPQNTFFSSGPCAKRPGWSTDQLPSRTVGRSHRAKVSKAVIEEVIAKSKQILGVP